MSYIEDLNLNEKQRQAFNFGFVGLGTDDVLVLMDIVLYEFENEYKHYYNLGNSYCKFETLKKIHDKSQIGLESLKEYGKFRDIFIDDNVFKCSEDTETKQNKDNECITINTTDLIRKMKGE